MQWQNWRTGLVASARRPTLEMLSEWLIERHYNLQCFDLAYVRFRSMIKRWFLNSLLPLENRLRRLCR